MSSITESRSERGQILIIFAFSLMVVFGVAALVFDGGFLMLDKRTQQNAADAAALAGARFLPDNTAAASAAAYDLAADNGFVDGVNGHSVTVNIPPQSGAYANQDGFVEVVIDGERSSFFAGIWGIFSHDVGARAVGVNQSGPIGPFAMLSLNPHDCGAVDIGGTGQLISNGDVQVNSDATCPQGALRLRGQGEIVTAPNVGCNVVGDFGVVGGGQYNCDVTEGAVPIPDPYAALGEPPIPTDPDTGDYVYPQPPEQVGGSGEPLPNGCPGGSDEATHADPQECQFNASYDGTAWRLFPGYYPGGLKFQGGDFYLEPGVYYVAAGDIWFNGGSVSVTSVDSGTTTHGGGVLLFNGGHHPSGHGVINLHGGGSGVRLLPLTDGSEWNNFVIYQDRHICADVLLNGGGSELFLAGVVYVPCGLVTANGNGGTIVTDQIVADRFMLTGSGGTLNVRFDDDFLPSLTLAGLIE